MPPGRSHDRCVRDALNAPGQLRSAADATDNDTVKNSSPIELGALKGNVGDQNYDIPADLDLNKYKAVCIWCDRFSVNFGAAPLAVK